MSSKDDYSIGHCMKITKLQTESVSHYNHESQCHSCERPKTSAMETYPSACVRAVQSRGNGSNRIDVSLVNRLYNRH
jgi:hypothetical protein